MKGRQPCARQPTACTRPRVTNWDEACGKLRAEQVRFNRLLRSREDVRPEWYLRRYGGFEWEALYRRVCEALRLKP
jgi:hypothetical protein